MEEKEQEELRRQSLLLESLEHNEAFRLWRKEVIDPMVVRLDYLIADSDQLTEPILRANVKLRYLLLDATRHMFDRVRASNEQDRSPDIQGES